MLWTLVQQSPTSGIEPGQWWIIVFTALTALFTGVAAFIAWQVHQNRRVDTGRAHPVVIRAPQATAGNFRPNVDEYWEDHPEEWGFFRVFELYIFNRSNVHQRLTIEDIHVWRNPAFRLYGMSDEVDIPPHEGGNFPIRVVNDDWASLSFKDGKFDASNEDEYLTDRHAIYLKAGTLSGHTVRYFGIVEFRSYHGAFI